MRWCRDYHVHPSSLIATPRHEARWAPRISAALTGPQVQKDMTMTTFSFDQRNEFIAAALAAGGSTDVSASFCDATLDATRYLGRYARQYMYAPAGGQPITTDAAAAEIGERILADTVVPCPDVLVRFHAWTRSGVITLDRVPFGTRELADAAYALLASAGCSCNDASRVEEAVRKAALAARATPRFINLTPHALHIRGCTAPDGAEPDGEWHMLSSDEVLVIEPTRPEARAEMLTSSVENLHGIPVSTVSYGAPVGLPAPERGVYLIVSTLTAQAAVSHGRDVSDLLTPGRPVRDERGVQIGCIGLQRVK